MVTAPLMVVVFDRGRFDRGATGGHDGASTPADRDVASLRPLFGRARAPSSSGFRTARHPVDLPAQPDGDDRALPRPRGLAAIAGRLLRLGAPRTLADVMPEALLVVSLVLLGGRRPGAATGVGLVGAWFFITLAPTSTVVPMATEVGAERRMYPGARGARRPCGCRRGPIVGRRQAPVVRRRGLGSSSGRSARGGAPSDPRCGGPRRGHRRQESRVRIGAHPGENGGRTAADERRAPYSRRGADGRRQSRRGSDPPARSGSRRFARPVTILASSCSTRDGWTKRSTSSRPTSPPGACRIISCRAGSSRRPARSSPRGRRWRGRSGCVNGGRRPRNRRG